MGLVVATNRYIDRTEPWALAGRDQHARLRAVLYAVVQAVGLIGAGLTALLPGTAAAIAQRVTRWDGPGVGTGAGAAETPWTAARWGRIAPGTPFLQGAALFPRLPELSAADGR
jgi:methionyl-tRNA synthetase